MRLGFSSLLLSVMLIFSLSAGVLAQSNSALSEQAVRKEKAKIVVVNKKERDKQQTADEIRKPKADKRA